MCCNCITYSVCAKCKRIYESRKTQYVPELDFEILCWDCSDKFDSWCDAGGYELFREFL